MLFCKEPPRGAQKKILLFSVRKVWEPQKCNAKIFVPPTKLQILYPSQGSSGGGDECNRLGRRGQNPMRRHRHLSGGIIIGTSLVENFAKKKGGVVIHQKFY